MDDGSLLAATMALSVSGVQTLGRSTLYYKVIPRLRDLLPSFLTIDKSSHVVWIRSFVSGLNHQTKHGQCSLNRLGSLRYTSHKILTPPLHSRVTRLSSLPVTLLTTPFTQHQHWMDMYPSGTLPTSYGSMSHLFIPSTFSNCLQIDLLYHLQMVLRAHGTWWMGNPCVRQARSSMRRRAINSECKAAHPLAPTIPSFGGFLSRQMLGHGPTLMVLSSDSTALVVDLSLSLMLGISLGWGYLLFYHRSTPRVSIRSSSLTLLRKRFFLIQSTVQHLVVIANSLLYTPQIWVYAAFVAVYIVLSKDNAFPCDLCKC